MNGGKQRFCVFVWFILIQDIFKYLCLLPFFLKKIEFLLGGGGHFLEAFNMPCLSFINRML